MNLNLQFDRPIVFFDLETTGLDVSTARIVEIALLKVYPDSTSETFLTRVNPGIPIPVDATNIHGINNFDVMDKPRFNEIAKDIHLIIEDSDLAGYNLLKFDLPLLVNELKRAGVNFSTENVRIVDVLSIYKSMERRDLAAAYRFYCNKELVGAHSALKDAQATLEIFSQQLTKYATLPRTLDDLHKLSNRRDDRYVDADKKFIWQNGEAAFTFGKFKGQLLRNVVKTDRDYLSWMAQQVFSEEVINIINSALKGQFPQRPERDAPEPEN
ncbi:MAG: exonuclease domain-containing protein [Candidatus Zhuqueibacterota bacterium]